MLIYSPTPESKSLVIFGGQGEDDSLLHEMDLANGTKISVPEHTGKKVKIMAPSKRVKL